MASINTVPVTNFPQEVELRLTLVAKNQEDLDYIKNELVSQDLEPFLQNDLQIDLKSHSL